MGNDEPHIHLNKFCQSCNTKAGQYSEAVCSILEVFEWTAHADPSSSCKVCCFLKKKSTGGRLKKTKMNRGRPLSFTTRIMCDAPNSMKSSIPLQPSRFLPTTFVAIEDLQCSICNCIVDQPVETPCRKLVCSLCIVSLFRSCDDVVSLPHPSSVEYDIDQFLSHYHTTFPRATVTPKLHMMEDHVVDFIDNWRVGIGMLGE